jgi:hypothetical protein
MGGVRCFLVAALTLALVGLGTIPARQDDKPRYTIKEIMRLAHRPEKGEGLLRKVVGGRATEDEKKKLVELYVALGQNKPPRGDAKDWKDRTDALIKAAREEAAGEPGAYKSLLNAAICADCHERHKGNQGG